MVGLELSSPASGDGERTPDRHGYTEDNTSLPPEIRDVPSVAESLLLAVDDPDTREPAGEVGPLALLVGSAGHGVDSGRDGPRWRDGGVKRRRRERLTWTEPA